MLRLAYGWEAVAPPPLRRKPPWITTPPGGAGVAATTAAGLCDEDVADWGRRRCSCPMSASLAMPPACMDALPARISSEAV